MADEGWAQPEGTRKFHYFRGNISLCGSWIYFGDDLEEDNGKDSPDDCKACRRKLRAET